MERKKASDYPQELLDLFHEYQHGDMTRRDFFDRIQKFAVGGVTAVALWESGSESSPYAYIVQAATRPAGGVWSPVNLTTTPS